MTDADWQCNENAFARFCGLPKNSNQKGTGEREQGEPALLLCHLAVETQLGAVKHRTFCYQHKTLSFVSQLQLQQLQTPPFTKQTCCLKAVTLNVFFCV